MATELRCGEMFPGCEWVGRAETEEEVLAKGAEHAAEVHGIEEIGVPLLTGPRGGG